MPSSINKPKGKHATHCVSRQCLLASLAWLERGTNYHRWLSDGADVIKEMANNNPVLHSVDSYYLEKSLERLFSMRKNLIRKHGSVDKVPHLKTLGIYEIPFNRVNSLATKSRNSCKAIPKKKPAVKQRSQSLVCSALLGQMEQQGKIRLGYLELEKKINYTHQLVQQDKQHWEHMEHMEQVLQSMVSQLAGH